MYTSVSIVRVFAGIVGNLDITTASITTKILMAQSIMNGKFYDVYTLPLAETPSLVEALASELAAAMVLSDEYGAETEGTGKDGAARYDRTMAIIDQIQARKLKLVSDTTGSELALTENTQPDFSPNDTTETADDTTSSACKFGMNDVY